MPKGVRVERVYTGKAAKLDEKVKSLEAQLKDAKAERDAAYKEQLREERKAKKSQSAKLEKELLKAAKDSGMPVEEIIEMLKNKE